MTNIDDFEFYRDLPPRSKNYDEGSVELGNVRSSRLNEGYERALNGSIASEEKKPVKRNSSKKISISKPLLVLAAVGLVVTMTFAKIGVESYENMIEDYQVILEFCDDIGANDALRDASWGRVTDDGYIYGYNQNTLADYVSNHENPDMAVFALYNKISMEKTSNMDAIVCRAFSDCSSWDDYLIQKGFVDKDGNPSNELYSSVMTERVKAEQTIDSVAQNHGIKR